MAEYLKVGQILNYHGLFGDLKIRSLCENNETLFKIKNFYLGEQLKPIKITNFRDFKKNVLAHIDTISNIDEAKKLKRIFVYAKRNDIPISSNKMFIADLIGCEVINVFSNKIYGKIFNVLQNISTEVYHIKSDKNKEYFMPVVENIIVDSNICKKKIFVKPFEGIFDDEN